MRPPTACLCGPLSGAFFGPRWTFSGRPWGCVGPPRGSLGLLARACLGPLCLILASLGLLCGLLGCLRPHWGPPTLVSMRAGVEKRPLRHCSQVASASRRATRRRYARSKLCNLLFAAEWRRRHPDGPTCVAISPGRVDTGIFANVPPPLAAPLRALSRRRRVEEEHGAIVSLHVRLGPPPQAHTIWRAVESSVLRRNSAWTKSISLTPEALSTPAPRPAELAQRALRDFGGHPGVLGRILGDVQDLKLGVVAHPGGG